MSTVDIPEEAMDVAWRAFAAHEDDYVAALADAITAAAPLIVAAELRRFAGAFPLGFALVLTRRANELDPPGGAS